MEQVVALCFEGVCAYVSPNTFAFNQGEDIVKPRKPALIRQDFTEALASFRKATNESVTIVLYTFLSQEQFDSVLASSLA